MSLLPLYIFGNLHCLGMCGPLVMMIGHHRYRSFYFAGRLLSYSLAGGLAGEAGSILQILLQNYYIPALLSFSFGFFIILLGICSFFNRHFPGSQFLSRWLAPANRQLSLLILRDQPWPAFLFGFFTVALPCGQTVIVFAACALYGVGWVGLLNGFVFALLTSPSLYMAMHAQSFLAQARKHYNAILGGCALLVGSMAICRGGAEMGWIPHLIINFSSQYHLVIF